MVNDGDSRAERGRSDFLPGGHPNESLRVMRSARRRLPAVLAVVSVTLVAILGLSALGRDTFTAGATVHVPTVVRGSSNSLDFDAVVSDRRLRTYSELAGREAVVQEALTELGLEGDPRVDVEVPPGTELITIAVRFDTAAGAAAIANYIAEYVVVTSSALTVESNQGWQEVAVSQIEDAQRELDTAFDQYLSVARINPEGSAQVNAAARAFDLAAASYYDLVADNRTRQILIARTISVSEPARVPEDPSSPGLFSRSLVAVTAGLVAGLGLALYLEARDPLVVSPDDIAALDRPPLLGVLSLARIDGRSGSLGSLGKAGDGSFFDESITRLRTAFVRSFPDTPPHVIMVTSTKPGEGKSTVTVGLGAAIARTGMRVALVDANLRSPRIHELTQVKLTTGLTQLADGFDLIGMVQRTSIPGLDVVSAGSGEAKSLTSLPSSRLSDLFSYLRVGYDLVIVDAPSMATGADAVVLSPHTDSYIMVVRSRRVGRTSLMTALSQLDRVRAVQLGLVLNGARESVSRIDFRLASRSTSSSDAADRIGPSPSVETG